MEVIWKCFALTLTVICICIPVRIWTCPAFPHSYGNITLDQDLEIGSTFTIDCTLFSNVVSINDTDSGAHDYLVSSEDLILKYKNTTLVNPVVINPYTIRYTKENGTIEDTGYYSCYVNTPPGLYHVCSTHVAVGYKPLPVANFSCVGMHFELLNCSWDKPFNPVKTKYDLYDIVYNMKRNCGYPTDRYCVWSVATNPPYRKMTRDLEFRLIGRNSLGTNVQSFGMSHYAIVKPDRPTKLTFSNFTTTSVKLQWFRPKGMEYEDFPPGLDFWMYYCPASGQHTELCQVINTTRQTSIVLTNLVPFMEYRISLRCRSATAKRDDMWSGFVNATFQTHADVPHLAPEVTSSSFEVLTVGHMRDIILFWKPILSKFEYGPNFHYVIHYHTHYRHPRYKRETVEINVGNATSHKFRLDVETAYLFKIFAVNDAGASANSSILIVDKNSNMIKPPTDFAVLSYGHGLYQISWKPQEITPHNDLNFTLFWCPDIRPRPFKCAGMMEWMITSNTSHQIRLPDNSTNYQFAIAANINEATSGMTWASCIVPYGGVLYGVHDVMLTPKNATSIRIHWVLDCSAQKAVIKQYLITYCAVSRNTSCIDKMDNIQLNNTNVEQHIVGGLRPFTKYKFNVQARTNDGWSEESFYKYETTLSAAPDGPPRSVKAVVTSDTIIKVTFQPPLIPNGIVTRYAILYGTSETSEKHRLHFPVEKSAGFYEAEINKSRVFYYTNYSIQVQACVDILCSRPSEAVYVRTGIGIPGPVEPPHTQIINSSLVNITWKLPSMPNGPVDRYLVSMVWQEGESGENNSDENIQREIFNVSENFLSVNVVCPEQTYDGLTYYFSIQAVNLKNGSWLIGQHSEHSQTRLCFIGANGLSPAIIAGLIAGVACGLIIFVISVYALAKWMKTKVDMVKSITVQLPCGLDPSIENPLNSYDQFKSGLQKNRDSGIPSEHTYERLCSYASDKSNKDFENFFEATSEEFLNAKEVRDKSGRNQSGDSNASGKCHDSISSSNTNKTHLSIDSGAEMDLPQSPDGIFSDTSSSNTTPRSYKPDLEIVEENNVSSSKDSGLEREGLSRSSPNMKKAHDVTNGFPYYIRKKNQPYFNVQMLKKNGLIQPYSKFAIIAPAFTPKYVTYGVHSLNLLNQQTLANSEPSVADAQDDDDDDSEPLVMSGVPPYCRFGLARSAGNGINIVNQTMPVQPNLGYSKFGIIYSTMGQQQSDMTGLKTRHQMVAPNYTRIGCSSVIQNPFAQKLFPHTPVAMKALPDAIMCKSVDDKSGMKVNAQASERKPVKGYVSFNQALGAPLIMNTASLMHDSMGPQIITIPEGQEDKLSEQTEYSIDEEVEEEKESLQQRPLPPKAKSYVSFQDAKVMSARDHLPPEDAPDLMLSDSDPSTCSLSSESPISRSTRANVPELTSVASENVVDTVSPCAVNFNEDSSVLNTCNINPQTLSHEENSSKVHELNGDPALHSETECAVPSCETSPKIGFLPCQKISNSENAHSEPQRTIPQDASSKSKCNGYVPWTELLDSADKPSNFNDSVRFPSGTNNVDVAHV